MPSNKPKIVIRTEQEIIDKLDYIAKNENRSRANMAEQIILEYIDNYENNNKNLYSKENLYTSKIG